MDGLFVLGIRPKSKKAVKEAVKEMPHKVVIEYTGMYEGYTGTVEDAPEGDYSFVGPDPYTDRRFYGTITKKNGRVTVT